MGKISAILFSISLILIFSPTFVYYLLRGAVGSSSLLLIVSVAPFILGIILSVISKKFDYGESK